MADDVQPLEPPALLLQTAQQVVPRWLHRVIVDAGRRGGVDVTAFGSDLDEMVERAASDVLRRLGDLLATDVDEQRTTPLTLFREATQEPTAWLRAREVPASPPLAGRHGFDDDHYDLGPATWSDIDPDLHEPGLTWGAWKAMTILARRRDAGLR